MTTCATLTNLKQVGCLYLLIHHMTESGQMSRRSLMCSILETTLAPSAKKNILQRKWKRLIQHGTHKLESKLSPGYLASSITFAPCQRYTICSTYIEWSFEGTSTQQSATWMEENPFFLRNNLPKFNENWVWYIMVWCFHVYLSACFELCMWHCVIATTLYN